MCSLSTLRPQRVLRGLRPLLPFQLGGGVVSKRGKSSLGRTKAESRFCGPVAQKSALLPRFTGLARARDRSSLHVVRKENNGRKSWFRTSTVSFSPFSCSSSLPAGLTTLAACPAAPAARARAPEVPARLSPASAGPGRAGPLPRWPRPRPRPRPRPSASAFAYGLGLGLALGLGLRLGLDLRPRPQPASYARVACWSPAVGCRAWPASFSLLAGTSLSALLLGASRRHSFGSNASQAAELCLLGFRAGLAWLIKPYQAPPGPASP